MTPNPRVGAAMVPTQHGRMLVPQNDVYVGRALVENGVFSPDEFAAWAPYLPDGGVVLDVGANIGGHTFAFAEAVGPTGRVIACEPQRMLFAMLCGSQALIGAKQVWPRWCACGAEPGVVFVPDLDYDAQNNFGGLPLADQRAGDPVACVPIDAWDLDRLDFLKVDVEGMELSVLTGAEQTIQRCRPVIAVEADRGQQYPHLLAWALDHQMTVYLQTPLLGSQWGSTRSKNLLLLPAEKALPEPLPNLDVRRMTELEPVA